MTSAKELRKKSKSELSKSLLGERKKLVELRMNRKVGALSDGSKIAQARKEVARVLTILEEKRVLEEVADKDVKKND